MTRLILLDNEAAQALGDPGHPKHRRVLSHVQVVTQRKRRAVEMAIAIPTAVRVEAGWDRTDPRWAFANRLRIRDEVLDTGRADTAATVRLGAAVSVPDAHLGAVIRASADQVTVLTSDPGDIRSVAGTTPVVIVTI